MADSFTPYYNLVKPEVGASRDTWGSKVNDDISAIDLAMHNNAVAAAAAQAEVDALAIDVDAIDAATLKKAGGTMTGALILAGAPTVALNPATKAYTDSAVASALFPAGTIMLFAQTSAPTGWTKSAAHNNKALRVVSGTASSGGTVSFTTAFASQAVTGTVGDTALTEAQLPAHTHAAAFAKGYAATPMAGGGGATPLIYSGVAGSNYVAASFATNATGSGGTHAHTFTGTAIDLAVAYVDVILASKD